MFKEYVKITGADFKKKEVYLSIDSEMVKEAKENLSIELKEDVVFSFNDTEQNICILNGTGYSYREYIDGLNLAPYEKDLMYYLRLECALFHSGYPQTTADINKQPLYRFAVVEKMIASKAMLKYKSVDYDFNNDEVYKNRYYNFDDQDQAKLPIFRNEQKEFRNEAVKIIKEQFKKAFSECVNSDVLKVKLLLRFRILKNSPYRDAYLEVLRSVNFFNDESYKKVFRPKIEVENWEDFSLVIMPNDSREYDNSPEKYRSFIFGIYTGQGDPTPFTKESISELYSINHRPLKLAECIREYVKGNLNSFKPKDRSKLYDFIRSIVNIKNDPVDSAGKPTTKPFKDGKFLFNIISESENRFANGKTVNPTISQYEEKKESFKVVE